MCGIFGLLSFGNNEFDKQKIQSFSHKIEHRGPDCTKERSINAPHYSLYLKFARLAIIDTSDDSNDLFEQHGVYMVCNGEIYNYKYLLKKYNLSCRTGSDCEVILQMYFRFGNSLIDHLHELDGVFAFFIVDTQKEQYIIARDRIGVRPLFIHSTSTELALASEAKAISSQLVHQFSPGHYSIGKFTYEAQQSGSLIPKYTRWYNNGVLSFNCSLDCTESITKRLLIEAVRKRLMSDRPVGFLVSGGLDSSLVAAIANDLLDEPITTFSIGLEGSPDLLAAKTVADYLKSNHHEIIITPDNIKKACANVVYYTETYDITTIRASIPMFLIAEYISTNTDIKVIFSGEGADELFGGYLYFHKAPNEIAFNEECNRLLDELHLFDVLRADRTTAAHGLELRVPFLDADLVSFVSNVDARHKMPSKNEGIEKFLLRNAFKGYLPESILMRQKEAFSDGVGYNSVKELKRHANNFSDLTKNLSFVEKLKENQLIANPITNEAKMYFSLFSNWYSHCYAIYTGKYWMPSWCETADDPSATILDVHKTKK